MSNNEPGIKWIPFELPEGLDPKLTATFTPITNPDDITTLLQGTTE